MLYTMYKISVLSILRTYTYTIIVSPIYQKMELVNFNITNGSTYFVSMLAFSGTSHYKPTFI